MRIFQRIRRYFLVRKGLRELLTLSDERLRDIGYVRGQLRYELARRQGMTGFLTSIQCMSRSEVDCK